MDRSKMKIGSFEDRIAVEFHRRFGSVWVGMLDDFGVGSGSGDEPRLVEGLRRGLKKASAEVERWLETPDVSESTSKGEN